MDKWSDFLFLCGSSAAGLTGLMFIAVTFGARMVTKDKLDRVDVFMSPFCFHFIHTFFLCCVASMPDVNPLLLGFSILLSTAYRSGKMPGAFQILQQTAKEDIEVEISDWLISFVAPTAIYSVLLVAGAGFIFGQPWAIDVFAVGLIALLFLGMRGAWDMIIWIAIKTN